MVEIDKRKIERLLDKLYTTLNISKDEIPSYADKIVSVAKTRKPESISRERDMLKVKRMKIMWCWPPLERVIWKLGDGHRH